MTSDRYTWIEYIDTHTKKENEINFAFFSFELSTDDSRQNKTKRKTDTQQKKRNWNMLKHNTARKQKRKENNKAVFFIF